VDRDLRAVLSVAAAIVALGIPAVAHGASPYKFQTPSRNIQCAYARNNVSCVVLSERMPPIYRGWRHVYTIVHATPSFWDDYVIDDYVQSWNGRGTFHVLAYGRTIRLNRSIGCMSRMSGLTCRARSGHGFLLSRERRRTF
jgi:hypothetical protein